MYLFLSFLLSFLPSFLVHCGGGGEGRGTRRGYAGADARCRLYLCIYMYRLVYLLYVSMTKTVCGAYLGSRKATRSMGGGGGGAEGIWRVRFRGKMKGKKKKKIINEGAGSSDGRRRRAMICIFYLAWLILSLACEIYRFSELQPAAVTVTAAVTVNQLRWKDIDRVQAFLSRARMSPVVERDMGIGNI